MAILSKDVAATLVSIKLTDKGREFLAKGFKDDNVFDIVKFSFGDSEVDYTLYNGSTNDEIMEEMITIPSSSPVDLKNKLYVSGVVPNGEAVVSLSNTSLNMTTYQSGQIVSVSTTWAPIDGIYLEEYSWTNLGPLEDYNFKITKSLDTKSATIAVFDTIGTTTIKVEGMTSGEYALLTLNIS